MHGTTGAVDNLRRSFVKLPGSGTESRLQGVRNKLNSIAQAAGLAVGAVAAFAGVKGLIKLGADLETSQANFAILTGSIEKGKKLFEELTTFANRTPFGNEDINKASLLLLNFGVAQKEILPTMQQLGDISSGNAENLRSLAVAFGQVSSLGRLQGQDLLQMINVGFNPLEYIVKRTGESMGELKKRMSKGQVGIEEVKQAMVDATSSGGRFYKALQPATFPHHFCMRRVQRSNPPHLKPLFGHFA